MFVFFAGDPAAQERAAMRQYWQDARQVDARKDRIVCVSADGVSWYTFARDAAMLARALGVPAGLLPPGMTHDDQYFRFHGTHKGRMLCALVGGDFRLSLVRTAQ